jgi:hypothetical protein
MDSVRAVSREKYAPGDGFMDISEAFMAEFHSLCGRA